jgi:hypothetical protein
MAITAALSTNQQGVSPIPGVDMVGIFTITWDNSSDPAGEALDLRTWFSTVDAIIPAGVSAIGLAGYQPAFFFTPGATTTATSVKAVLGYMPALDGNVAAAQPLTPADSVDVAALGTTQVIIYGKAAH